MEPKIQLEIGKESLLCKLTPEEREERLQAGLLQVARAAESRAKEAALKEAAKDAKEEAESADREMRRLFGIVKAGGEQRGVEVVTVFDAASGMVQKVRTDTNELLETRPPTEIDKQRIDLQRQRSLPGMGGGEVRSEPREPKGKQRRTEEVTGSVH
jgi:hypothetical protein